MPNATASSWEPVWDDIFASRSWGTYPSESLIRFIARNYYNAPDRKKVKILDLGAGTGANTTYLAREGFDTYAIDGSAVAVDIIAQKLKKESLEASLASGDIRNLPYADNSMDCIVEINCVMCNNFDNSKKIIQHAVSKLKPGGRFFSMCAKEGSWGDGLGEKIEEATYKDAEEGPYAHMGTVRFLKRDQIQELFSPLENIEINSCSLTRNNGVHDITFWLIDGIKK